MAALAPGLVNLVLNSTKVENFAVASGSFTMVAAFLVIITALCGVVSHWCLGADLAWLSQLSQQSLPALRSKPPKDLILPTDQDISICITSVIRTKDHLGFKSFKPIGSYRKISAARKVVTKLKVRVWRAQAACIEEYEEDAVDRMADARREEDEQCKEAKKREEAKKCKEAKKHDSEEANKHKEATKPEQGKGEVGTFDSTQLDVVEKAGNQASGSGTQGDADKGGEKQETEG